MVILFNTNKNSKLFNRKGMKTETNKSDLLEMKNLYSTQENIAISDIPSSFQEEFNHFFFGKTLIEKNNKTYAYAHDIRAWVRLVFEKYS